MTFAEKKSEDENMILIERKKVQISEDNLKFVPDGIFRKIR